MTTLSLIVLRTAKPEALLPFYQALDLEFQREQHGSGPVHFSCEMGEAVLEIYPPKKNQSEADFATPMLGFRVHSLEETLEKLRGIGVENSEIKVSDWGRWCNVLDSDGRIVQLMQK